MHPNIRSNRELHMFSPIRSKPSRFIPHRARCFEADVTVVVEVLIWIFGATLHKSLPAFDPQKNRRVRVMQNDVLAVEQKRGRGDFNRAAGHWRFGGFWASGGVLFRGGAPEHSKLKLLVINENGEALVI